MNSKIIVFIGFIMVLFFVLKAPEFFKLKTYQIRNKKVKIENTIISKFSIASTMFYWCGAWGSLFGFARLFGAQLNLGTIILLTSIFSAPFVLLSILTGKVVFNDYGITARSPALFGKKTSISWDALSGNYGTLHYPNLVKMFYLTSYKKALFRIVITPLHTNYIECLEYAIERIPKYRFSEDAQKKLKKMGIGDWDETNDVTHKV